MENNAPAKKITTDYSYGAKDIILTIVTGGIWRIYRYSQIVNDTNMIVANRPGAKQGMNYWLVWILGMVTCGFFLMGYNHSFFKFVGDEARSRGIKTDLSSGTYWLWGFLGAFIVVGPFICDKKILEVADAIKNDYNARG